MSLKYRTDIVPFATVNAEYINPMSYSFDWLNKIVRKIGIPFLPMGPMLLLVILQPWMFYFALPAKIIFVRGKRIRPWDYLDKPFEEISEEEIYSLRDKLHEQVQHELEEAVEKFGQKPYELKELWRTVKQQWHQLSSFMPFMWPILFFRNEEKYFKWRTEVAPTLPPEVLEDPQRLEEELKVLREDGIGFWDAVKTLFRYPQILLLYVPVGGLFSLFMAKKPVKVKKR